MFISKFIFSYFTPIIIIHCRLFIIFFWVVSIFSLELSNSSNCHILALYIIILYEKNNNINKDIS